MIPTDLFINAHHPDENEIYRTVDRSPYKVQFLDVSQDLAPLTNNTNTVVKAHNNLLLFYIEGNFWDIIKNQVHIFPSLVQDFGLVLSQQSVDYYVWNAYTDKSVTVREVSTTGDFGATFLLDIAGEFTLDAGKGVPGELTVYMEGPVSASTEFTVSVRVDGDPVDISYVIVATCTRIIIFPFDVDWTTEPQTIYKFSTQIATTIKGVEQRRPLYGKPNRSVSFTVIDSMRGLTPNAINFAMDKNVGVPLVQESFRMQSISTDKFTITSGEDLTYLWNLNKYARYVGFLDKKKNRILAKEISIISGNNITFTTPFLETFDDLGNFALFPLLIGVFKTVSPKFVGPDLVQYTLVFDELIGENQPVLGTIPALPSVFPFYVDFSKDFKFDYNIWRDVIGGTGTAQYMYPKYPLDKHQPRTVTFGIFLKDRQQQFEFLNFIAAAKGRHRSFEFKSPVNEIKVVMPEYPGAQRLRIETNFFAESVSKLLYNKVTVKYRNYSVDTTIIGASSGSTFTTIFLGSVLPFQIFEEDMADLRMEKWHKVRMDLDEITVVSKTTTSALVSLRFKEVL